jgi:GGDEF domain-containing protein
MSAAVTASAGVAFDDEPTNDAQVTPNVSGLAAARARLNALDVRSERAATAAKKDGRNRAMVYAQTMADIVDER